MNLSQEPEPSRPITDQAMEQLWNNLGDYLATIGAAHHCPILLFFYPKAKNVDFEIPFMVKFSLYDFTCVFDTAGIDYRADMSCVGVVSGSHEQKSDNREPVSISSKRLKINEP